MKKLLTLLALLIGAGANAQTLGDVLTWKKGPGLGDAKLYTTPVNSSLFSLNSSGNFALLAQSNFANASHTHPASAITDFNSVGDARWSLLAHTHVSADITDASNGGNGTADAAKIVKFRGTGGILATTGASGIALAGSSTGGVGVDARSVDSWALYAGSQNGEAGWFVSAGTASTVKINANGASLALEAAQMAGGNDDIATFSSGNGSATITTDGGVEWTGTGAQTTATNLPAFGTATKGVVPASGGGTTNFLRADGTWTAPGGGGSGTVTSVAALTLGTTGTDLSSTVANGTTTPVITLNVPTASASNRGALSAADWSTFNSKEASITAGTTGQYWRGDKSWQTLNATAVGLGSVENTALSTWAGTTNITTLGTISTGSVPAANVSGLGTLALMNDGAILSTGLTFPNYGLRLSDDDASNSMRFAIGSDLTDARVLTFTTGDANRTLTLGGDATLNGGTHSGTNTGDQSSIVGITGSLSDFNTALTGADFATGGGTATGTNTGDQTNISGNAATVTTNANLTGPITSVGNATTIAETELAAIAGLTSAANKGIQFTGSGTAALIDLNNPGSQSLAATVTITAGGAPTTPNNTYNWVRIGNLVTYQFSLIYGVAGTTVTNVLIAWPSDMPAPFEQSGLTAGSDNLYPLTIRATNGDSGNSTNGATGSLRRNAGDSAYEFNAAIASGTYSNFFIFGSYFAQ